MAFATTSFALARQISGVVADTDRRPLEFVTVASLRDSIPQTGVFTDSLGHFTIPTNAETTGLRFTLTGFKPLTIGINPTAFPDTIFLHPATAELQELVVTGKPITYEADRFILNLNSDPMSKGKNISQVLQTAPGVWLDRRTLSVLGKSGTQVYINDRRVKMTGERLYNYLQSIPASTVTSVEVIPIAGAEYSASFGGGVIKINLKSRTPTDITALPAFPSEGGERDFSFTPTINFLSRRNKLTFNLLAGLRTVALSKGSSTEESENKTTGTSIHTDNRSRSHSFNPNVLLSGVYDFTSRTSLGVEAEYTLSSGHSRSNSQSLITPKDLAETSMTRGKYSARNTDNSVDARVNFNHTLDSKGSLLKILGGVTYRDNSTVEDNEAHKPSLDSIYDVRLDADLTNVNGEVRIQKNFTKVWKLLAGVKHTYNTVGNKATHTYLSDGEMIPDLRYDYDASYRENISALYVSVPGKIGIVSVRAGLRAEHYRTSGTGLHRKETGLFPSAFVSLPLLRDGSLNMSANYTRRVKRPTFWQQSPLVRQFSDYTYTVGNLNLVSSITNSVSLSFLIAKRFTLGASWSDISNPIRQMFATDPKFPDRLYLTYGNLGHERNLNVYFTVRVSPLKNWTIGGTLVYLCQSRKMAPGESYRVNHVFQSQLYSFLTLPKRFTVSVNGYYYTPMQIGNIRMTPFADLSLTIGKSIGKSWSLFLSADNILQLKSGNTSSDGTFYRKSRSKDYATVSLMASYSFSSGKKFRKKKIENPLDDSRLNKE